MDALLEDVSSCAWTTPTSAAGRWAQRAGFALEGVLRGEALTPQGEPRDTRVYARVRCIVEAVEPA